MFVYFVIANILAVLSIGSCSACVNPEVTSKGFTTQDATVVTNIAYVSEFTVKCSSGAITNLYADVAGNVVPVSVIGPNKYQVSWTEDLKNAYRGDKLIRLFDEDGNAAIRKAIRDGADISSVSPLFSVILNHPGAFTGPWLKSEFLAVVIGLIVAYVAVTVRSKLVQ